MTTIPAPKLNIIDISQIPPEQLRRNWTTYANLVSPDLYDKVWIHWSQKFNIKLDEPDIILGREFIENKVVTTNIRQIAQNGRELILSDLPNHRRANIHALCDKLGIHHQSLTIHNQRQLHLYKPDSWLWEFSTKNPYTDPVEESKRNRRRQRLARKYCSECGVTGLEAELFVSPYRYELYCEDCLETTSDGDGGLLCDHKFEPI